MLLPPNPGEGGARLSRGEVRVEARLGALQQGAVEVLLKLVEGERLRRAPPPRERKDRRAVRVARCSRAPQHHALKDPAEPRNEILGRHARVDLSGRRGGLREPEEGRREDRKVAPRRLPNETKLPHRALS